MYFYINPLGVVSLPVNHGFFYKFSVRAGQFLSIEEVLNGAASPSFVGCVEGISADDVFKMCYFSANHNDIKRHKAIMYGPLKWIISNLWRSGKLPSPQLGSTFTVDGTLNILGESSSELISKVSEAVQGLMRCESVSNDIIIRVSVLRAPAKNPTNPLTVIEVQAGEADSQPGRPRSQRDPLNKRRKGTPRPENDDDEDD